MTRSAPAVGLLILVASSASAADGSAVTLRLRTRVSDGPSYVIHEADAAWDGRQTAVIVCDMWDAHHCLNATRRVEELAPRMDRFLEEARRRGALVIHAPSGCMDAYKNHPARKRAQDAPTAATLPPDIGQWCQQIPSEARGTYPIDQSDGGEDDDPVEHARWHERLAGMGRNPRSPWKAETGLLTIRPEDAITDSGVEVWNLLEHRGVRNVLLVGVHTNMCVLGRPFGLRQLARNGKTVALVRDLTDSMYNPARWPYVTHFVGTDRVVEHVEKYVCPTVTSSDLLGGEPFRFKADRRSIAIMIGEDEYRTWETLPAYAKRELEPRGFRVRVVQVAADDKDRFPGLADAVRAADLVVVSVRRRLPPPDELDALRAHVAAGKPLVGLRTASHAFTRDKQPQPGAAGWPEFDGAVLGGHYTGHHGGDAKVTVTPAPGAKDHPILRGVDPAAFATRKLYRSAPLAASTTPLLVGAIPGNAPEPVAWTNEPRTGRGRVFYTSLGHPDDFETAAFRRLLLNGICWCLDTAAPGEAPAK